MSVEREEEPKVAVAAIRKGVCGTVTIVETPTEWWSSVFRLKLDRVYSGVVI